MDWAVLGDDKNHPRRSGFFMLLACFKELSGGACLAVSEQGFSSRGGEEGPSLSHDSSYYIMYT